MVLNGIDSIGSYWFYCNTSNEFGQKCLLCTTDLSHVIDSWRGFRVVFLREVGKAIAATLGAGRGEDRQHVGGQRLRFCSAPLLCHEGIKGGDSPLASGRLAAGRSPFVSVICSYGDRQADSAPATRMHQRDLTLCHQLTRRLRR